MLERGGKVQQRLSRLTWAGAEAPASGARSGAAPLSAALYTAESHGPHLAEETPHQQGAASCAQLHCHPPVFICLFLINFGSDAVLWS